MSEQVTWQELRRCAARVPTHVVLRAFAAETVLLNIQTGQYHGIDSVGGRFLEVVCEATDIAAAARALAVEYGQPIDRVEGDLATFVGALHDRGLLELT